MEYGRLVVLGYSSYRVDMVQRHRSGSLELSSPSFGLADPAPLDTTAFSTSASASASSSSHKRSHWKPLGDQNAHFVLEKRPRANGVCLRRFHHVVPVLELQKMSKARF
ncbi:unnamed protein product [Peronospora destructor]|uniref:Uncharacterized protein n=1 Tax=Peronospora destructor TaxID=86335 RepID=A0AAV0TA52_9STRA|nr:unnamed protein product [Peronospora destructor]